MKKVLIFASTFGIALSAAPFAFASGAGAGGGSTVVDPCATGTFNILCNASLSGAFGGIITAVFVIAILLALGWLIYGGIRWILSQGDKGKVESARNHIIAALIGLIIVFLSYFLINIVTQLFFHENIKDITNIPTINLSGAEVCDLVTGGASNQSAADSTCVKGGPNQNPPVTYTKCVSDDGSGTGKGHCQ